MTPPATDPPGSPTGNGGIAAQYTWGTLLTSILGALEASGKDPEHISPDDLAGVEEFHTLGRPATLALANAAGLGEGEHVLDAGSGIGGPARTLARTYGCTVTGVDATAELCEVAEELNRRSGAEAHVRIVQGDALALPFRQGVFDVAWTQHVSMNIADKEGFYRELRRVVRPGGRLAFFDVLAGPTQPIHFPVPWADTQANSHLAEPEEVRRLVGTAGFDIRIWEDVSEDSLAFFLMAAAAQAQAPPDPLGMHLLIKNMKAKVATLGRNLAEERVRVVRVVADATRVPQAEKAG